MLLQFHPSHAVGARAAGSRTDLSNSTEPLWLIRIRSDAALTPLCASTAGEDTDEREKAFLSVITCLSISSQTTQPLYVCYFPIDPNWLTMLSRAVLF